LEEAESGSQPFSSTVAGERLLAELSAEESATLCREAIGYYRAPNNGDALCRWTGYLNALFAALSGDVPDAELRRICRFEECSSDSAADSGDGVLPCAERPAGCEATVAESVACFNDMLARYRQLAAATSSCDSVTQQRLRQEDTTPISMLQFADMPASCITYQSKCSGVPSEVQAFAQEFCALVEPCCVEAGLGARCLLNVYQDVTINDFTFDPVEAGSCLGAVRERVGADFCARLGRDSVSESWYLLSDCFDVFTYTGDAPSPGTTPTHAVGHAEPCYTGADCAPGPNGRARCPSIGAGSSQLCLQTTAMLGAPCIGTDDRRYEYFSSVVDDGLMAPTSPGYLCDHDQGLHCDPTTRACVANLQIGDACSKHSDCPVDSICDPTSKRCGSRLPLGSSCTFSSVECTEGTRCVLPTSTCAVRLGAGAPCNSDDFLAGHLCESGRCEEGACTDPLLVTCGARVD